MLRNGKILLDHHINYEQRSQIVLYVLVTFHELHVKCQDSHVEEQHVKREMSSVTCEELQDWQFKNE